MGKESLYGEKEGKRKGLRERWRLERGRGGDRETVFERKEGRKRRGLERTKGGVRLKETIYRRRGREREENIEGDME